MTELGDEILKACKRKGMSLAQASKSAGLKYSTLHAQINHEREIPFSSVDRLSGALNMPISHFSGRAPGIKHTANTQSFNHADTAQALATFINQRVAAMAEMGYQIGTDDVLDWLTVNDSRLVNHDWLIERVNLYYPAQPGDEIPRPYRIGSQSLSSRYFRMLNTSSYAEVMDSFDAPSRREIIQAHLDVINMKYLITDRKIDTTTDDGPVRGTYRRLLAPVTTETGDRLILAFSKLTHFSSR